MADSIVSFSGLASGIQWRDLVDQIIVAESTPITRLQSQIDLATSRGTVWTDFKTKVQALKDAVKGLESGDDIRVFKTSIGGVPAGVLSPIASASADSKASPGTHSVTVLSVASSESIGSTTFASRDTALGFAGDIRINGRGFQVTASDTLDSIAQRLNSVTSGSTGTGVSASVLSVGNGRYRLILTATKTGAAGIDLSDGGAGVLESLGLSDGTTSIKTQTSSGAQSDALGDSTSVLAGLLGFATPPAAGSVTIGGVTVNLDLATLSLDDVASAINSAASGAGSSITASVVDDTSGTVVKKRLDIRGTTSFVDANHILESIGVLEAGRGSVAQEIKAATAFTAGGPGSPATASTQLAQLWGGGASAGVSNGDTLTFNGTRGDGSTFSITYTVASNDTVQDVLDRLNSSVDGFKAGGRTATASIDANGQLTVTDDNGGPSRLNLSIIAHNEGGGTLDTGSFGVTTVGVARQITVGSDAEVEIDGSYFTDSSNIIRDKVPGLTLNLQAASPNMPVTVSVDRDVQGSVAGIKAFIDAYNSLTDFVATQLTPPPEGQTAQPLYGDGVLRSMRTTLRLAMNSTVADDIASGMTRLADLGIEIQKDGKFKVDDTKLNNAVANDGDAVARLFGLHGMADNPSVSYLFASDRTVAGTYAIDITQAASAATVASTGFSGTYIDDATPDTIIVKDMGTGKQYVVQLSNGMSVTEIVDVLNAEFGTAKAHQIVSSAPMYADAVGTAATDSTTFDSLFAAGGASLGAATGDLLTISGTRSDGSAFAVPFQVTDAAITTLGDLRAAVQSAAGSDVDVRFDNGTLTVTSKKTGSNLMSLAISSDNAGGGSLSFGTFDVIVEGRGTAAITASDVGGELTLTHSNYGSAQGFDVSFVAGGADGTASLGLAAGQYTGVDVAGTIGGIAATGAGQILTGTAGSAVEGLGLRYTGTSIGALGDFTFSRGIASAVRLAADPILGSGANSVVAITDRLGTTKSRLNDRITSLEGRLDRRKETLIRQFTLMEQAMAKAQAQSEWLAAQIKQFQPSQRNN
jgi:flagellar hook-associated protein 2